MASPNDLGFHLQKHSRSKPRLTNSAGLFWGRSDQIVPGSVINLKPGPASCPQFFPSAFCFSGAWEGRCDPICCHAHSSKHDYFAPRFLLTCDKQVPIRALSCPFRLGFIRFPFSLFPGDADEISSVRSSASSVFQPGQRSFVMPDDLPLYGGKSLPGFTDRCHFSWREREMVFHLNIAVFSSIVSFDHFALLFPQGAAGKHRIVKGAAHWSLLWMKTARSGRRPYTTSLWKWAKDCWWLYFGW